MTYCVGVLLDAGLVLASDCRTNAGVDRVACFRKMHVYEQPGERVIVLLSSGNLAMTQGVVNLLERPRRRDEEKEDEENLWSTPSLYDAAALVGNAMREVYRRDSPYLIERNIDASASFILGGQIRDEPQRLFTIYTEGNFIEASPETTFFQRGETKYGKPILDRVITRATSLKDATKCVLVSFDSTMRSNISVGLPIDILSYERDSLRVGLRRRILEHDPYFSTIHSQWAEGVRRLFHELPDPHWEGPHSER
jgi:putative proteasome-type protease